MGTAGKAPFLYLFVCPIYQVASLVVMGEKRSLKSSITRATRSGKVLVKFLGLAEEILEVRSLIGDARLVLNSKRDAYYTTAAKSWISP
jgi:hypothetical protein